MKRIDDAIRTMVGDQRVYSVFATVVSVDKTKNTCEVEPHNDDANYVGVNLQASTGKGVVLYPVVGSVVIVSLLDEDSGFVSMTSQVELVDIQTENESLKAILVDFIKAVKLITVTTPAGPSGVPINAASFDTILQRIPKLLK